VSALQKIAGFEATDYAWRGGRIVWAGADASVMHPRHATSPWQPTRIACDAVRLQRGARLCLERIRAAPTNIPNGLLLWLTGRPLAFPLEHAAQRFDALRSALQSNHLPGFEAAARRVLGLGHGLTPSGDDFLGGIAFTLHHAPRPAWRAELPASLSRLREHARGATNPISAALLDDLIDGASYAALQGDNLPQIEAATQALLRVGASSGADMLSGLLLAAIANPGLGQDLAGHDSASMTLPA
jgi:Protein of unknown function (DUF2877)